MSKFLFDVTIRWSDLDAQGHVNHAICLDYLEDTWVNFFSMSGSSLIWDGLLVVNHSLEYIEQISYDANPIRIELQVTKLGAAKIELFFEAFHWGKLKFRAHSTFCSFDFTKNIPTRLAKIDREHISKYLGQAKPFSSVDTVNLNGRGYSTSFITRWSDLDSYRHVNNVKFVDFMQQARIDMTAAIDPQMSRMGSVQDPTYMWLVARQNISYLKQLNFSKDPYQVLTAVTKVGRSSITFVTEITDFVGRITYSRGSTVLVCADLSGKPVTLPETVKANLNRYQVS